MAMSTGRKARPQRRPRKAHAARRHDGPDRANRRPDPWARTHVVIARLEAIGWRVMEFRPLIEGNLEVWRVTIERVDLAAKVSVTALDPDDVFEELARYTASDVERE